MQCRFSQFAFSDIYSCANDANDNLIHNDWGDQVLKISYSTFRILLLLVFLADDLAGFRVGEIRRPHAERSGCIDRARILFLDLARNRNVDAGALAQLLPVLPALVCLGLAAMACSVMDQFVPPANGATSQPATEAQTSVPARGLPTPNIFTGMHEVHSQREWVSLQDMEKAVETLLHLAQVWAGK